jgi:site-specific DNA recombinase
MINQSTQNQQKAVIYCRVSTKEQVEEGNSLSTQEKICREYTQKNGYEVVEIFIERGESAKTADRTELQKLLLYCSNKKNGIRAIIVYKLDRLSRNTDDYSQLRILLKRYGVEIKSTSEHFENTPVGRFMENTMANIAQFDNDVRAERCSGGMKDAIREGRYVWMAPIGYSNVNIGGKATIAPNEMAPLIKETFDTIAKGIYATEDVRKMMAEKGLMSSANKPIIKSYFYQLLKNRMYIGIIDKFGESHKGLFEPIVSEEIFNQVQRVLKNRGKKMSQYKLDNEDFPLRRFIFSPEGKKLTGSWSRGRSQMYAFYRFSQKGSNYQRDEFEKQFMAEMDRYRFNTEKIEKLKKLLIEKLSKATNSERLNAHKLQLRIKELTEKQNTLVQKNIDGVINDTLLKQQLEIIDKELGNSQVALMGIQENEHDPAELIALAEDYLENPSSAWKKAKLDKRVKLQWFQFPSGLVFDGSKFGTAEIASVFKVKESFSNLQSIGVDPTGLEPATSSVQMRRSTR